MLMWCVFFSLLLLLLPSYYSSFLLLLSSHSVAEVLQHAPSPSTVHDAGKGKYLLLQIAFLDVNSVLNAIVPCQAWSLIYATPTKMAETAARPFCLLSMNKTKFLRRKCFTFLKSSPWSKGVQVMLK